MCVGAHLLLLKMGEVRLNSCLHCSFLCLCGASHGRSFHVSFKWVNFAEVKDEDCQLLCTRVCRRFALAWVLPGSLAGDPCWTETTLRKKGSTHCSSYTDLCLALVLGLTVFSAFAREKVAVNMQWEGGWFPPGTGSYRVAVPSETALSCVGWRRAGRGSGSCALEKSVASAWGPGSAGLVPPCFSWLSPGSQSCVVQSVPVFFWLILGEDVGMREVSVSEDFLYIKYLVAALGDPLGYVTKSILMILM